MANLKPDAAGRLRRQEPSKLQTPWRHDQPDQHGGVRVYDRGNDEILVCELRHAEAIVKAVNWCSSRGYLK